MEESSGVDVPVSGGRLVADPASESDAVSETAVVSDGFESFELTAGEARDAPLSERWTTDVATDATANATTATAISVRRIRRCIG